MSYFKKWGFEANPFKTSALGANHDDLTLLVGREREKKILKNRIRSDSGIVTIEGENGIGKTSLINACSFELYEETLDENNETLYIPCNEIFQLSNGENINDFIDGIYFSIAQTIIEYAKEIKSSGLNYPKTEILNRWLNIPENISFDGQIAGFGGGFSRSIVSSDGFTRSGFKKVVVSMLNHIFKDKETGGIICIIDNLELLKNSKSARERLEVIRDEIITLSGTKWFFSGSNNIFLSIVSSPRLSGLLLEPVNIGSLKDIDIPYLLKSRIQAYKSNSLNDPYLPITESSFIYLYKSLNGNIRETLKKLSDYCLFAFEEKLHPYFESEKDNVFHEWFENDTTKMYNAIVTGVNSIDIKLLNLINNQKNEYITNLALNNIDIFSIKGSIKHLKKLDKFGLITIPIYQSDLINSTNSFEDESELNIFTGISISPKGQQVFKILNDLIT